jgi:CheY-like chemotaxis protein
MVTSNKRLLQPEILKDVQILVVDNDRDTRELYAFVLESCGARVATTGSIKNALDLLSGSIPAILICEARFLGEQVHPLIEQIRSLALKSGRTIPILVASTCSLAEFTQQWKLKTEAYLLKPFDLEDFVDKVWNLTTGMCYLPNIQDCVIEAKRSFALPGWAKSST